MKILRTTSTFYPHVTGPAYQAYKISQGMERRGHSSPIVTTDVVPANEEPGYPPDMDENEDFPFDVIRRKPVSDSFYRSPPGAIYDYFNESPDVIHCHGYHNPIKDIFYLGNLLDSKPLVIHGHGSFSKEQDPTTQRDFQFRVYDKIWFRTVKRADAIVVSSEQERRDAISFGIDTKKIWTIPVGKEQSVYQSVPADKPNDTIRLLFVGRLAPRRNLELLINAVSELPGFDAELRIVGGEGTLSNASRDNYIERLKSRVDELEITDDVTFTGPKYGDALIREYRNAHMFVNPTHYENFGQANLEAAFAGLPLIATPTGVAIDLITEGETGYFFEDKSKLAKILSSVVKKPDRIEPMGEKIKSLAEEKYTWDRIFTDYLELYESLL